MPSKVMTSAFVTLRRHSIWKMKLGGVKKVEWEATLVYGKLSMVKHQGWHITTTNKKKQVIIAAVVTGSIAALTGTVEGGSQTSRTSVKRRWCKPPSTSGRPRS
jgi:hypothetical protein